MTIRTFQIVRNTPFSHSRPHLVVYFKPKMREIVMHFTNSTTCLVTGATSGIGFQVALRLAKLGATVVLMARNQAKCEDVITKIRAEYPGGSVEYIIADLGGNGTGSCSRRGF